jgi:hypothetical protein
MKRLRVTERPKQYYELRTWWLHELRQLRSKNRVSGVNPLGKARKYIQRELVKIRRELQ